MVGIAEVRELGAKVAALARSLEPDTVALPDALPMWEAFDAIERQAAAAQSASFAELRDEALRARAQSDNREAVHRRIHAARRLRTWTDAEGAWNLSARGTVVDDATVMRALNPIIDALSGEARRDGRRDEHETYAFDALVALAERREESTTKPPGPKYLALLRADWEALLRGEVHEGEVCEITGLGPIPATTARELLGDAILELVVTKGVDVLHVTHLGRGPTAAQRVALMWSSPGCSVEGCPRTRVEIDHREPYAKTRHTKLDELDPFCGLHHYQKHHDGWSLVEGTGKRAFVPLDDPRHPKNRPKPE